MNYQLKIKIQNIISKLPYAENLNYILQKYVTKSLPVPYEEFKIKIKTVKTHFDNLKKFGTKPISDSVYKT